MREMFFKTYVDKIVLKTRRPAQGSILLFEVMTGHNSRPECASKSVRLRQIWKAATHLLRYVARVIATFFGENPFFYVAKKIQRFIQESVVQKINTLKVHFYIKNVSKDRQVAKVIEKMNLFWWGVSLDIWSKFTPQLSDKNTWKLQNRFPLVSYNILPIFKWQYWEEKMYGRFYMHANKLIP